MDEESFTAKFSRLFPFLQRFHFPPFGEPLNPQDVTRFVQLSHEIFRADVKHAIQLKTIDTQTNGAGVDIDQTLIEEPPAGFISVPLQLVLEHTNLAGGQVVIIKTVASGNAADVPTGTFGAFNWFHMGPAPDHLTGVPWRCPIPRGVFLRATWTAPAAPRIVRARGLAVWVPLECVDWCSFAQLPGYVRTEAI